MIKISLQIIKFSIKNAFRKKLVAVLSISGIAIGITLMVVLSSSTAGLDEVLNDRLAETVGDVEISEYNKEIIFSQLPTNISDIILTIDSSEEIEAISPEIVVNGFDQFRENLTFQNQPGLGRFNFMQLSASGVAVENDALFDGPTTKITEGRLFENDYEIIIADSISRGAPSLFALNQEVEFRINDTFSIQLTVVGTFEVPEGPEQMLSPSFVMSVETGRIINSIFLPFEQEGYNLAKIRFDTNDIDETRTYAAELEALTPKLTVTLIGESAEAVSEVMSTFETFRTIISVITLVAGGMAIIVSQLMGINERMKEFAIMKATGWKNATIFLDIVLESVIIGITGSLIGFGLGASFVFLIQMAAQQTFIKITWQIVLSVVGFGLGIGLIGGLIPGYQAARVKPMEVIRGL